MIYTTFKQWVKGRFLETGEPRKQAYSKDELALIEMGWGYGYDAGVQCQKSQQALDRKAENARELGLDYEPVIVQDGDILEIETVLYTTPQPKREWVNATAWRGLTDEEIAEGIKQSWVTEQAFQSAAWWAEAKLKEKNT
jgi:hypothetical protein